MKFRIISAYYPYNFDVWQLTEDLTKRELRCLLLTVFLRRVTVSDDIQIHVQEVANKMNITKYEAYRTLKSLENRNWIKLEWITSTKLPVKAEFTILEVTPSDLLYYDDHLPF